MFLLPLHICTMYRIFVKKTSCNVSVQRTTIIFFLVLISGLRLAAQDSVAISVADTVYLAPDTVVMQNVVYIEYSGTPERYWSLSAGASAGNVRYRDGGSSALCGGNALLLRNEERISYGIGISSTAAEWKHTLAQVSYTPFQREETYKEVLDSFGKITGLDTVWTAVTRQSVRTAADSSQSVSYLPTRMQYRTLGLPIQLGYEFKSGFLFARGYAVAEPGALLYRGSRSFVVSAGAGIQASYMLQPRWALWSAAQYLYQLTDVSATGGQRQTVSLSIGASYIWGGE